MQEWKPAKATSVAELRDRLDWLENQLRLKRIGRDDYKALVNKVLRALAPPDLPSQAKRPQRSLRTEGPRTNCVLLGRYYGLKAGHLNCIGELRASAELASAKQGCRSLRFC